ncbi:MAG: 2-succinyl-5-enolpyruvyl-6-hydroxy-3-cyclohexene-1-carboxylic-acid synthase, partial [Prevotella sp.]|nr:2-succinyl-5-enolpyruvyl-6-hydroxy-3-cyclohexene-1-carboxylic-acid synthase [Prevotella sp.]
MMYTNKENVNILTALLVEHGVRHAVVCPGSRNAPITHNLVVCPDIECCNVVDERSAGFYALGMALATACPVAVCVTSGTALLNLMPAVAEASYQSVPLVVVSADRPPQWIDQLDGQTLPQGDALGRFVRKAVTLPEPHDDEERWFCNRLVNEALLAARRQGGGPVHINVPLSEPLYEYTVEALPDERTIFFAPARSDKRLLTECAGRLFSSRRPMIVVGQTKRDDLLAEDFAGLHKPIVVLNEALSIGCGACHFDEVLANGGGAPALPEVFTPDFVLYLGGELVSKRLKQYLRQLPASTQVWAVSEDGEVRDTFCHLHGVIEGHPADVLAGLSELTADVPMRDSTEFFELWDDILANADEAIERSEPSFSPMAAVRMLEEALDKVTKEQSNGVARHYANSTAVRLANRYARGYVWCNRGVNGIEGTLSTAAGFSLVSDEEVVCVIGDLSFFYDQNALWQR